MNKTNSHIQFIISDSSNYKSQLDKTFWEINYTYLQALLDYYKHLKENYTLVSRPNYNFYAEKGLNNLNNVFRMLLVSTKNLELTFFHTIQGHRFYLDFAEHMQNSENVFMKLSLTDALLYSQRKTVYDIDQHFVYPTTEIDKLMLDYTNKLIDIYFIFFKQGINSNVEDVMSNIRILSSLITNIYDEYFMFIDLNGNETNIIYKIIDTLYVFVTRYNSLYSILNEGVFNFDIINELTKVIESICINPNLNAKKKKQKYDQLYEKLDNIYKKISNLKYQYSDEELQQFIHLLL